MLGNKDKKIHLYEFNNINKKKIGSRNEQKCEFSSVLTNLKY